MIDWFALSNELPEHPKTHRLARALRMDEAGWYVVRLFAWCSKHCVGGVFAADDAEAEVEFAAGWRRKPGQLYAGLLASGFLERRDDGAVAVHDWWDWNGRAIAAAEAEAQRKREKRLAKTAERQPSGGIENADRRRNGSRRAAAAQPPGGELATERQPSGDRPATPDEDEDEDEDELLASASQKSPPAGAGPPPAVLRDAWNAAAAPAGLPEWRETNRGRERAARARLRERPLDGQGGWVEIIARIAASPFCRGENDRGWRADAEFLLRAGTAAKVLEGKYDAAPRGRPGRGVTPYSQADNDRWAERVARGELTPGDALAL